jgi:Dolichyl-phosphate-mannose-protein mannosyltransferase
MSNARRFWLALILLGVIARIAIVIVADNHLRAPWSGGGDAPVYQLLAQNLLNGRGLTYCSQPTALRAPGYPVLLATLMWVFADRYVIAVRGLQFLLGLATVYFCSLASALAFGKRAGQATAVIGLFCPPLLFVTGEVLTECIGALFGSLFFYLLVREMECHSEKVIFGMGIVTGVASLFRFNMAGVGLVGAPLVFLISPARRWHALGVFCLLSTIPIVPWVLRNQKVFHKPLYSTLSGHDAVEGVVAPQGRALPGDNARIEAAEGWLLTDIETNNPSRLRFPSEDRLNTEAWASARILWSEWRWRLVPLAFTKLSFFWLSLDQVFWTQSFSPVQRLFRWTGVLVYWGILALAVRGWFRVWRSKPTLARAFLFYAIALTTLHLPFPMLTRLRIPLMDPLIIILTGSALIMEGSDVERKAHWLQASTPDHLHCP